MLELERVLDSIKNINTNIARNIILFVGDGMSLPTVTAGRIYKAQQIDNLKDAEGNLLTFEKFPHIALSKTYCVDKQTPDSASTASAIFTGVKTNFLTMGFDNSVEPMNPDSQDTAKKVDGIMKWAHEAGKDIGFVTNTRITHATPAALYAHVADRAWECDRKAVDKNNKTNIEDINLQLVRRNPGRYAKVVLGGGRESWCPGTADGSMINKCYKHPPRPASSWNCSRLDGVDVIDEFMKKNENLEEFKNMNGKYVSNRAELLDVDSKKVDYLLGLFSESYMKYESERENDTSPDKEPSLSEMTEAAIKILRKNKKGFFLMVEGGKIDKAHHQNLANQALHETAALDKAVEKALILIDTQETLVIVTADHGHTMSIAGYQSRGADIRGLVDSQTADDNKPYMILSYASGPGFRDKFKIDNNQINRVDLNTWGNYTDFNFKNPSSWPGTLWSSLVPNGYNSSDETHSGADVGIFATGPYSHLFQSVHEQSYIAYVMAYSACIGLYKNHSHCTETSENF